MVQDDLTDAEQGLFENLPGPPELADIRTTNIWIIEWLSAGERRTGRELHDWIKGRRPGWSAYCPCKDKREVIGAIERATNRAQQSEMVPVLHLEAHGGDDGLAQESNGGSELLTWDELTDPLQQLNVATRCNLLVVVAACTGFAAIQALRRGPRAPAVALVGPSAPVTAMNLLWGTKEFYRRLMDPTPRLRDIAASASQEVGPVAFEWEPFAILCYEALVKHLIVSIRPAEQSRRLERIRERMHQETQLSVSEIERRVSLVAPLPSAVELQRMWDEMFMIDLYPANRERFGVDMTVIVEMLEAHRERCVTNDERRFAPCKG